jgi:predicted ATPase
VAVEIIKALQDRAPDVTVLVTSQHVLDGLKQEVYWLRGLDEPPSGVTSATRSLEYGAVKLFIERARSGNQNFVYTDDMVADATAICARVDGNPLSLEMVAARVHFYGMEKLRRELDEHFGMLYRDEGTADKRHLSQLNMTAWSYNLLHAEEQEFFCRLGIFPGWFSSEEAVALAAADSDDPQQAHARLLALVKKSMVVREDGKAPRYRLLATLRFFAHDRLKTSGERKPLALRHARHVLEMFVRDEATWETLPDRQLRQIYAPQIDNLRLALETMLAEPELIPSGITLLGVSGRLWSMLILIPEGQGFFDRYMPFIGEQTPPADAARFLRFAGILCRHADRKRTVTLLEQSAAIYRKLEDWLSPGVARR